MADLSTLPACLGNFNEPTQPNKCSSCEAHELCIKVTNDVIFAQLMMIKAELKRTRQRLAEVVVR